jgi:hypothetical protein
MKKVKMLSIGLLFASTTIFLSSCATLLSGTKDRIVINSTPPDADVYIDGKLMGKSGQDIMLKRKFANTRQVNLRKEGYEDLSFGIDQKITGAYWLNVPLCLAFLVPGVVGFIVDISTGAALKPKQTEFNRTLTPKK